MSFLGELKAILGIKPVSIAELNRVATHDPVQRRTTPQPPNPLEGIEVTEEYRKVAKLIEAGAPIVFVSGKAGTGKSTLIHYIRHSLKKQVVVVAPTGVAALNVGGATIHSFFRLPPRIVVEEDIKEVKDRRLYTKLDLLIVDEVSMVRADLIDAMDLFLRINGRHRDRPFGGVQLLLVGDLLQLPPVVTRGEETVLFGRHYESPYFFSAKALQEGQLLPVELGRIFRQRDTAFMEMLSKVREAESLEEVIPSINAACANTEGQERHLVALTTTNAAADRENREALDALPGEPSIFEGVVSGKFAVEEERLPAPLNLALKPGAQVMFTKNDSSRRWVNGTIGRVHAILEKSIQVELLTDHPGAIHEVTQERWESFRYTYDYTKDRIVPQSTGFYVQFPLTLAWAVTIHKAQGKTLERVRVDLGTGAFAPGQVYVALSRCRSLSDITLVRPIQLGDVKCDPAIKRFYQAIFPEPKAQERTPEPQEVDGEAPERCPVCGGALRERNGRFGPFFGCSNYPRCRYTRNVQNGRGQIDQQ
ncbi:AAA family ATPase [Holophaga foetida]|uniref:AAA family ATPase n=1 Tax=Holophaga foetida TaxID=35839 RepID=UPI00024725C6|nr:AAA family ATPase [Holophaga foetida]